MNKEYPPTIYGKEILIEVPIQLCIKDFLREGGCAFDAGANIGALSIAMSRIVGPKGKVFSFEPNPFTLPRIKRDLDVNKCNNVMVVPKAVWSESHKLLPFYCEDSYYAAGSRLFYNIEKSTKVQAESITIDDFCSEQNVIPDVIKLDVEGVEYQTLLGSTRIINEHAPVIILEYRPSCPIEEDPVVYLYTLGYKFIDTNNYEQVQRKYYYARYSKPLTFNVLAIPAKKWKDCPYDSISLRHIATIDSSNSKFDNNSPAPLSHQPIRLNPGRYMAIFDFDGPDAMTGNLSVTSNNGILIMYEAKMDLLKTHACANMVFQLDTPQDIQCQLINNTEGKFIFRSINIKEIILGFNEVKSSITKINTTYKDETKLNHSHDQSMVGRVHFYDLRHKLDTVYLKSRKWAINNLRDKRPKIWNLAKWLSKLYWKIRRLLG